jgi:cystathionine beta-lyase
MILGRNTNKPLMKLADIAALQKLQKSNIMFAVDNTFATTHICKDRLTWVPMSSRTRLQNILAGHSDVIAGALIAKNS